MNEKWFVLSIEEIEKKLKTTAALGLSRKAARSRVNGNHGQLFYIPRKQPLWVLGEILSDFALIILLLVALISLIFEEYRSAVTVLVMLVGNLIFSWWLSYRSYRISETMASAFYPIAKVIRGGKLFYVDFRTVVPGDVLLVEKGDVLCCDARLVTSDDLRVRMRVDRNRYISLPKAATGHVAPNEYRAEEMGNMLHAGSIVETGSARAIVTSVGQYTYLGAMTGGIRLSINRKMPLALQSVRKLCSKINTALLIAVLPFSLISLLFSHWNGGTVLLSASFLTALSIVATTASHLLCMSAKYFYIARLNHLPDAPYSALIRSAAAMDKIAAADYIFMLDGCALTDGVLHFRSAVCAEGEIRNFEQMNQTAREFCEYVALYHDAATRMLTTGVSSAGNYFTAIREFISQCGVDEGALRIRCSVLSYSPADLSASAEMVCFSDRGQPYTLHVSCSPNSLAHCNTVLVHGEKKMLGDDGRSRLTELLQKYASFGQMPMIFTVSEGHMSTLNSCFVGLLVIKEGVDRNWKRNISRIERLGYAVITFQSTDPDAPEIPKEMLVKGCVSKLDLVKHQMPITAHFGKIRQYTDFEKQDILSLIEHVHRQKKRVLVMGFTEEAAEIAKSADGFLTCAPVSRNMTENTDKEIFVSESTGHQSSSSCTQTVKEKADCLIPRPSGEKGGLRALIKIMLSVKQAYQGYSDFLRYLLATQLIRVLTVSIPMLFGQATLDARHVIFFGCIFDLFALFVFVANGLRETGGMPKDMPSFVSLTAWLGRERNLLIASLSSVGVLLILPELFALTGIGELYHDKTEVSFVALLLLHFVCLLFAMFGDDGKQMLQIYRNKLFVIGVGVAALFLILCFGVETFGGWFDIESIPTLPYWIFAILPAAVFAGMMLLLMQVGRFEKGTRQK